MSFAEAYRVKTNEFAKQRESLPELEEKLSGLDPQSPEYASLKDEIHVIKSDKRVVEYIFSILPFVRGSQETRPHCNVARLPNDDGNLCITSTQVVNIEGTTNKGTVFAEYLRTVENENSPDVRRNETPMCTLCGCTDLVIIDRDATRICTECGTVETYQREDAPQFTFKEESENMTVSVQFAYKRSNHFSDWLNAFEAGMSTNSVTPEVLDTLRYELKKLRVTDVSTITPSMIRQLMKKTNLTKYYEYTNAICAEISGKSAVRFPEGLKCQLRIMFSQLQAPFQRFKPDNRKNFLSYSYVIYKCLQLLGQDAYLQYFTLLKSRDKLKLQDHIWRQICEHLKWEYISSV